MTRVSLVKICNGVTEGRGHDSVKGPTPEQAWVVCETSRRLAPVGRSGHKGSREWWESTDWRHWAWGSFLWGLLGQGKWKPFRTWEESDTITVMFHGAPSLPRGGQQRGIRMEKEDHPGSWQGVQTKLMVWQQGRWKEVEFETCFGSRFLPTQGF